MQIKSEFRKEFKEKRKALCDKKSKDNDICQNFLNSDLYKNSKQILCYAALGGEIDTDVIMQKAFEDNKLVALPVCLDLSGTMEFYYINSLECIKIGAFGIREPDMERCTAVSDYADSVCIVPALSFDKNGFRLGYGKGYYDRFIEKFTSISAGLCYNNFISDELPTDKYDKSVDYIFTENEIIQLERRL